MPSAIAKGFNPSLTLARLPFNKTESEHVLPKKIEILLCNKALDRRQPYSRRRGIGRGGGGTHSCSIKVALPFVVIDGGAGSVAWQ